MLNEINQLYQQKKQQQARPPLVVQGSTSEPEQLGIREPPAMVTSELDGEREELGLPPEAEEIYDRDF